MTDRALTLAAVLLGLGVPAGLAGMLARAFGIEVAP